MNCQNGDIANECHSAAPAMTYSSLIKWSLLHELALGWLCTNKASRWVERAWSSIATGDIRHTAVLPMRCCRGTAERPGATKGKSDPCTSYPPPKEAKLYRQEDPAISVHLIKERGGHCSETSELIILLKCLFQITPHICVASFPQ